jgi:hypothetical protein
MSIRPLNSIAGFSVGETANNTIILANGDVVTTNLSVSGLSNLGSIANVKITDGNIGQLVQTDGNGNLSFVTLANVSNANGILTLSAIANGTSSISIVENGNIILNVSNTPNIGIFTSTGLVLDANTSVVGANLLSANFITGTLTTSNQPNITSIGTLANLTVAGNLSAQNANLGNLVNANYVNIANDLNVSGNITGAIIVGSLSNGNSNVRVYNNSNVAISVAGTTNIATFTNIEFLVAGDIKSTLGNVQANGNITANGFLNGANANITGDALLGSATTATITAPVGNITINATGSDNSIILAPTGNGVVNLSSKRIVNLADPVDATDAVTKEYVDALAGEGLAIHPPVRVETPTALNATYAQGGTTLTVDSITTSNTINFGSAHGLSVDDGIVFTNSFNGITGGEAYWVFSVPSSTSITIKDGYFGPEITSLTNGTSLAQPSRANPGVGATLTNAGANAALTIDGISLSTSDRVLVYNQANAYENGVYTVTNVGSVSTQWVLTRATDFDKYIPKSPLGLGSGSYVFVTQGLTGAGESYVMTLPTGEVIIGTDNLTFTQFTAAGTYTAGNGINITGSVISANVDGITTDIVGGNIVVKANAQLTTPNIDAATGTSLNVTGNIDANNLSIGNLANIGGNLTIGGNIFANYAVTSNANVSGLNLNSTNNISAGGNIIASNITANTNILSSNANITGNLLTNILNVVTTANLGNVGNVKIAGGSNRQVLQTDGSGNLSWTTVGDATNVLYVSKSGNDSNSGNSLDNAKLTLAAACAIATAGTTIFIKAGDYTEQNPISMAAGVTIVGDNLRSVTIRPANPTQDILHVRNGCYVTGVTFRDHLSPSAAVAFPTTGAGMIFTSPYIQNCSSITTTGCGMRIDGSLATGLRSMVLDSYTQFNQGGKGIHIINQGYAQLVSIFTICCSIGIHCESGGQCSVANSNNAFGDFGLVADGQGPVLYTGNVVSFINGTVVVNNLSQRPAVNDSFQFAGDTTWYTVNTSTALISGESVITYNQPPGVTPNFGDGVSFYQPSFISASGQTFEYVGTGTNILTATPRLGGIPNQLNEVVELNGGIVNFTSTDQFGDFRIGDGLVINEEAGTISGPTFEKGLFAVLTPYILALEG